ncbi:MAG: hypothetical protein GY750_10260 [Lentisphaerae bacterium]|nr:hypothetical protein [Lentisphaerota bacterium]MCP4101793.1 hypothetical protein [Lentisphaerota bacterium]
MNHNYPVFTVANECQDCCKCVRHCPSKAIRVVDGRASVMPELCVACGLCVKICPAGAKRIRDDLSRANYLLNEKERVFLSLAPSWKSYFKGLKCEQLVSAVKKLGFAGVSETALGAELVSAVSGQILNRNNPGLYISSACPAAVDFIRKYLPECTAAITPVLSPLLTHAKMLRQHYGDDIGVVFAGPCAAKKQEADRYPELANVALTFEDIEHWFIRERVFPHRERGKARFVPYSAVEGRVYPLEGGMIETLRERDRDDSKYFITVTGLSNIERTLSCAVSDYNDMQAWLVKAVV